MIAQIIRGTTPTIEFKFTSVTVSDITVADLSVKQDNKTIISKNITTATVGQSSISWQLSQADTLTLSPSKTASIVCDWKLRSGVRGRSNILQAEIGEPGINEEI